MRQIGERWQQILDQFEVPAAECVALLDDKAQQAQQAEDKLINLLLRRDLRISYR